MGPFVVLNKDTVSILILILKYIFNIRELFISKEQKNNLFIYIYEQIKQINRFNLFEVNSFLFQIPEINDSTYNANDFIVQKWIDEFFFNKTIIIKNYKFINHKIEKKNSDFELSKKESNMSIKNPSEYKQKEKIKEQGINISEYPLLKFLFFIFYVKKEDTNNLDNPIKKYIEKIEKIKDYEELPKKESKQFSELKSIHDNMTLSIFITLNICITGTLIYSCTKD